MSNKQIPQKQRKNQKLEDTILPQEIKENVIIDNHRDFKINHEKITKRSFYNLKY